jgi:hypothetical protein
MQKMDSQGKRTKKKEQNFKFGWIYGYAFACNRF